MTLTASPAIRSDRENSSATRGFTLIELSIVLVIIGLIVGGVLVGRDLISAAGVRAQVTQIEKYNTSANTFKAKYGYLPGDINNAEAVKWGFKARASGGGQGDGDGLVNGCASAGNLQCGEVLMFWVDLSTARLLDGSFTLASPGDATWTIASTGLYQFYPAAKLGRNYVYVYLGGTFAGVWVSDGFNYFGLSAISQVANTIYSTPGLSVQQAFAIDTKTDDGLPQAGRVTAKYMDYALNNNTTVWAGGGVAGAAPGVAASGSSTTCYDNNNVASATPLYSITQNNGSGMNCALSFKFQ